MIRELPTTGQGELTVSKVLVPAVGPIAEHFLLAIGSRLLGYDGPFQPSDSWDDCP